MPLFQNEVKCETIVMKMSSACSFIFIQIEVTFIRMVSHLDSRFETEAQGNSEMAYSSCWRDILKLTPVWPSLGCFPYSQILFTFFVVQSLNSPFFPPHIGAQPGRAKEESRITCMHSLRVNVSRNVFLARALRENIFFDVDIVVKKT